LQKLSRANRLKEGPRKLKIVPRDARGKGGKKKKTEKGLYT